MCQPQPATPTPQPGFVWEAPQAYASGVNALPYACRPAPVPYGALRGDSRRLPPIPHIAAELGIGSDHRGTLRPCPVCESSRTSLDDSRGPIRIRCDLSEWACTACGTRGDAADLAAVALFGRMPGDLDATDRDLLSTWLDARGVRAGGSAGDAAQAGADGPNGCPDGPARLAASCAALWESCSAPRPAVGMFQHRVREYGLRAHELLDLVRFIPRGAQFPAWARDRTTHWAERCARLLLPLYGPGVVLVGVGALAMLEEARPSSPLLLPYGFRRSDVAMLNREAVRWAGKGPDVCGRCEWTQPYWDPKEPHPCTGYTPTWWIVPGPVDFLTAGSAFEGFQDLAFNFAAVGTLGEILPRWIADRIPSGSRVVVASSMTCAGDRLASHVVDLLGQRCEVCRYVPRDPEDWAEARPPYLMEQMIAPTFGRITFDPRRVRALADPWAER